MPPIYQEGDLVPGKGILTPDGSYKQEFPNTNIKNIGLEAGNPAAFASVSNASAGKIADESDQSRVFGLAIMDLLKQYQGIEKQPFARQGLDAEQAQARRAAYTPPELIGAAPGVQAGARNAAVSALEPTIQGSRVAGQTFSSQLSTFNDILGQAKSFMAERANAEAKDRDDARAIVNAALSAGSKAFRGLLQQQPDLIKKAGIDPKTAEFFIQAKEQDEQKTSGDTGRIRDDERALQQIYLNQPIVKSYNEQLQKKLSVDSIISSGVGGPADLALVYEFMKALDPSSVVRETEYATAAKSGNIFAGVFARFNGYFKEKGGFLPPQVKKAFQDLVERKFKVQETLYNNFRNQFRSQAERQGLDADNVTVDFGAANSGGTVSKAGRTFKIIP